ncbi:glycosyltransferase family protein [Pseudarthrobacter sp. P1]|uniref:glycosyltransferase family protein n=1 Tax=Pseudarthrobacter sp. P1 TaxID=3418418 RepID=UPI003CEFD76A
MAAVNDVRNALWHLRQGGVPQFKDWRSRQRIERGFASPGGVQGAQAGWTGRGQRRRLSFAEASLPERAPRQADVRAGVILDDFSALAFRYEWDTVPVHSHTWREDLAKDPIDLLFVESAWAGNGGLWRGKIAGAGGPSQSFTDLLEWCRSQGIPTVFWNKEDPPHYGDFLPAAKLFDHVFTSDSGRIASYHQDLGHTRVAALPFAAQPVIHNPSRPANGRHERDVAFAGMYFAHKYPERRAQMDMLLGGVQDVSAKMKLGLEIFSRKLGGDPNYQFPAPLDGRVVGSLTYGQMLSAYKAYKVFLNVNSVVDSPSMCARRIFEITAAGTPVVTAESAAIRHSFNELEVPIAQSREEAGRLVRALVDNPELNDRTVHLAQRKIWQNHTYAHRAEAVLKEAMPHRASALLRPTVTALVPTIRPHQLEQVFGTLSAQRDANVQLVLLTHGFELEAAVLADLKARFGIDDVVLLSAGRDVSLGECLNRCVQAADGDVLTKMDDDDHYGPNYLSDQLFALDYSAADIVGKQAHYMHLQSSGANILRFAHKEHRYTNFVMGPTIMARKESMLANPFPSLGLGEDTGFLRSAVEAGMSIYSADRFNYFQVRTGSGHTWQVDDAELLASGDLKFYGGPYEHVDV